MLTVAFLGSAVRSHAYSPSSDHLVTLESCEDFASMAGFLYIARCIHETVMIGDVWPSSKIRFPEREALPMTSPREYRRRARHLLQMAQTCQDAQIAARLRVIAADYFDAGQSGSEAFQQQQQVQPDKDAE
jgi:hypothetical protein